MKVINLTSVLLAIVIKLAFMPLLYAETITVDVSTDETGGLDDCELRSAILAANTNNAVDGCTAGNGDDLINFDAGVQVILLNSSLPIITDNLEITGHGPDSLVIDGDDSHRIIHVGTNTDSFTLRNIQLFQGNAVNGGCMFAQAQDNILIEDVRVDTCFASNGQGGGMFLYSEEPGSHFTLRRVYFTGNSAVPLGGGGLGITADSASILDSTFLGNSAVDPGGIGGGVVVGRITQLFVSRSTFWANQAHTRGSAISTILASQDLTIEHSTFSQNNVTTTQNLPGGAIYNKGTMSLLNSVVAGNLEQAAAHSRADVVTDVAENLTTLGHNLIGNNSGAETAFPEGTQPNGDQSGTADALINPELGALMDNGGSMPTSVPDAGSRLVDQGACAGEAADQRNYNNPDTGLRPVLSGKGGTDIGAADLCDIGAVERNASPSDAFLREGFESP
ncbi:MAG TPA: choice-of-anchor Q domain-containing protein [Xanthomonadales bacterium]|nr:choice-of-anchor Q domain-containing protein [Xanthomonadales bacterium]